MPDAKITDLGDGGLPQPTDDFVVARGVTNNKIAWSSMAAAATEGNVAIAGSNTTYTSGTVNITGVGGGVTVSSNAGQRIDISVAAPVAQSVQTQNVVDVTLGGNTAGALALVSSGTLTLAGGNNITVSQAGNAVTISGPNVGGAQTGISGIANSETTYTSGTVELVQSGGITISSDAGQKFVFSVPNTSSLSATGIVSIVANGNTVSIGASQSVQPETQTFVAGISASDTLYTSGNVRISGSQAATVRSGTGQLVIIDVPAQSVQPETQTFIAGISASDTLYTSGNVRITGVGGGVTVSSNTGQRIDISVAAQSVQPETQTFIGGISASNTLYTSGSVRFTGSQAVTVRSGTGQLVVIDAPAQTAQTGISGIANSQTTYTSGTVSLSELGAITIRSTTGNQYQLSVNSQSVQTQGGFVSLGVSTGGNTAGNTTVNTGSRFVIVASGNLTASQATAAGASTVTLSVAAQSVQPETQTFIAGVSASDTLYTSGNVRITGVGGGVTVSSNTGQRIDISVAAPVAQTNQAGSVYAISNTSGTSSGTYDARTLSIAGAGLVTVAASNSGWRIDATNQNLSAGVSTGGNTSGNTTVNSGSRLVFAGGNNITLSQGTAAGATTITISAPNLGAGAMSAGVSNLGNTAGSTGVTGTRLVLVGTNNITLSQSTDANGGTVSISGPAAGGFSGGVSTGGNTAGATGITGTQNVFVGVTPISLSQTTGANGGTISINAPATSSLSATGAVEISTNGSTISIGAPAIKTLADFQNFPQGQAGLMTHISAISKTPFYFNVNLPGRITCNSLVFRVSQVTASQPNSLSVHLGIYTAVNSTSMALVGSLSETYVVSSASSVSFSGVRNYVLTGIGTHTALSVLNGGDYGIGMMFSGTATNAINMSLMGASTGSGPLGLILPGVNQLSTGTSQGAMALWGRGSTTVNAMPANVVRSELVNQGSGASVQLVPWIYIRS